MEVFDVVLIMFTEKIRRIIHQFIVINDVLFIILSEDDHVFVGLDLYEASFPFCGKEFKSVLQQSDVNDQIENVELIVKSVLCL